MNAQPYIWICCLLLNYPISSNADSSLDCECGVVNDELQSHIVGGIILSSHRYPWMAMILKIRGPVDNFHCGGSIINNKYILTAAHCVYISGDGIKKVLAPFDVYKIILGAYDQYNPKEDTRKYYSVKEIKTTESYSSCSLHDINDIALMKLDREIEFSWAISPVCLPFPFVFNYTGTMAGVAGWGTEHFEGNASRYPKEALVEVISNSKCLMALDVGQHFAEDTSAAFCAFSKNVDACKGDSGGPLTISQKDKKIQIGIVSWGINCAKEIYPGVYTKLPNYVNWIYENTADAEYCDS
ncbi:chymotrypsinogen A-like [Lycorma delicatula]|uniref:chymotrypsinogen A-like n=1 Tax=Lycorma delicatula TaxID=130591 RepID=UPI003F5105DA